MRSTIGLIAIALAGCALPQVSTQNTAPDPCVLEYVSAFTAGRRLENVAGCNWGQLTDLGRSDRIQSAIAASHPAGGIPVGYKLTNAEGGRVVGVLTSGMLLDNAATVELSTGTRLLGEGDLLVRVSSSAINTATSIEQVAVSVGSVIPFIESSDMMLPEGAGRTKAIWTAANGNARWGVRGGEISLAGLSAAEKVRLLAELRVELIDETGKSLQVSGMQRNPLHSVLDVLSDMQRRGDAALKKGDLVSLGNFGRPRFPASGSSLTAVFHGLADPAPRVRVYYK